MPNALASTAADGVPLYHRIALRLAESIRQGAWARGQRLPSVRELARQQQVSVSTVVQAYRHLEDARLLETRPRSGYFVRARPADLPEPQMTALPDDASAVDIAALSNEVMRLAEAPDVISFGAACPNHELFDQERVRRSIMRAAQRHRSALTRYPTGPGHETLRRAIARHALALGCQLDPATVLITNGCQAAISLCLRAATERGDVVALESPTSFGFLDLLQAMKLRALEIPTHPRHGMSLDALQLALDTQPVKAILAVPTLSNPLGACMPLAERRRLAQMLTRHDVPLIEDAIYNDLVEHEEMRRAVKSFDSSGHVMLCGSFTKTLAPGIRLGWVDAGRWTAAVHKLKAVHHGGQTALLELALADLLGRTGHEASLRRLRGAVAQRVDEARRIIGESFPKGTRVTNPPGGYMLWLELPAALDSTQLYAACLRERICIAPGIMFSASGRYRHCVRIGVGASWGANYRSALRRIGALASALLSAAGGRPI
jgi:DNA-binding transcriptional MocR family regulator